MMSRKVTTLKQIDAELYGRGGPDEDWVRIAAPGEVSVGRNTMAEGAETEEQTLEVEDFDFGTLSEEAKGTIRELMKSCHRVVFPEFLLTHATAGLIKHSIQWAKEHHARDLKFSFGLLDIVNMSLPDGFLANIEAIDILDVLQIPALNQGELLAEFADEEVLVNRVSLAAVNENAAYVGGVIKHIETLKIVYSWLQGQRRFFNEVGVKNIPFEDVICPFPLERDLLPYLRRARRKILSPSYGFVSVDGDFSDETPVYTTEDPETGGEVHFGRNLTEAKVESIREYMSLLAENGTVPIFDADIELFDGIEIPVNVQSINRVSVTAVSSPTLAAFVNEMASRKLPVSAWVGLIHEYSKELVEAFNGYYDAIKDLEYDFSYEPFTLDLFPRCITPALKNAIRVGESDEDGYVVSVSPFSVNMLLDLGSIDAPVPERGIPCNFVLERLEDIPNLGLVLWPIHRLMEEGHIVANRYDIAFSGVKYSGGDGDGDGDDRRRRRRLLRHYPVLKWVIWFMVVSQRPECKLSVLPVDVLQYICEMYIESQFSELEKEALNRMEEALWNHDFDDSEEEEE